jgi:hypothetical protein
MPSPERASRPPSRAALAGARVEEIHRGSWSKADVYVVRTGEELAVVKDFAAKSLPIRWFGRLQIARECATYRRLEGIEGIARFLGRVDPHALALERLEGVPLDRFRKSERRRELLSGLKQSLEAMHARGVIHNDLRGKDNAFVRSDGRLVLLDFAGSFRFRPGSICYRLMFRSLSRVDEAAFLKWKTILDPDALTPDEEEFLRRFARLRRFWILNPKGALRSS